MKRKYRVLAKKDLLLSDITLVIDEGPTSFFTELVCRLHREHDVNMDDIFKIERMEA